VRKALFKRGCVRIVGEHATATRARGKGPSHLATPGSLGRDVNLQNGALVFLLPYAIFLMHGLVRHIHRPHF
jgi:hypothetical protein